MLEMTFDKTYAPRLRGNDLIPQSTLTRIANRLLKEYKAVDHCTDDSIPAEIKAIAEKIKAAADSDEYEFECTFDSPAPSDRIYDSCKNTYEYRLMRDISKQQIIFGGNYYTDVLPPTKSWLVWDKRQPDEHNSFADCELAWCSTDVARVIHYYYNGMLQGDMRNKDYRFHATQKPTQLYAKVLTLYTNEGDLILDPCAGSQALRIACHKLKRHYVGFEINKEYYDKGCDWYVRATAQISIFDLM